MMNEIFSILIPLVGGSLLGILFFGGLWLTVKKLIVTKTPALLMIGSFFFRIGIVLTGFYFIGLGDWRNLVACMIGFVAARFAVLHYTKSLDGKMVKIKKEIIYEA